MIPKPNEVDLVLSHGNCFDGFTALWVAWLCRGEAAQYIQVHHGEPPPWEDVAGRHVAILDFAYKRPVLEQMATEAASLIVLDHHVSAQADLEGLEYAIFDMDRSGARLAFDWFLRGGDGFGLLYPSEIERFCDYIQDRDLWRWQLDDSRKISEALKVVPFEFEAWTAFARDLATAPTRVAERGAALLAMTKQHLALLAKTASLAYLDEHLVWVANAPYIYASELGNLLCSTPTCDALREAFTACALGDRQPPDVAAIWRYDHAKVRMSWSLRSSETSGVDCSKIAVAHGGGGHVHAAGFEVDTADVWDIISPIRTW